MSHVKRWTRSELRTCDCPKWWDVPDALVDASAYDALLAEVEEKDRLIEAAQIDAQRAIASLRTQLETSASINVRLRTQLAAAEERCRELEQKLTRVRDALKFQANSEGGLVYEIDAALAARGEGEKQCDPAEVADAER